MQHHVDISCKCGGANVGPTLAQPFLGYISHEPSDPVKTTVDPSETIADPCALLGVAGGQRATTTALFQVNELCFIYPDDHRLNFRITTLPNCDRM
jgi:hypothetical protein